MKVLLAGIASVLLLTSLVGSVDANNVPDWVKNNAGWWADGTLTENEFVNALQYLIKMGIMKVSASAVSDDGAAKSQYQAAPKETTKQQSSGNADLDEMLAQCQGGENKREIRECEKTIKDEYKLKTYMNGGQKYQLGNVAIYYVADWQEETRKGVKQYNNIAYTATGQPLLNLQILVQNTGTSNETLMCTSPSICNYSVWDGGKKWVNSGSDFTSGNIVLKPGQAKFANILWGPAIGYGSYENFEYDSGKDYYLRISEPFGKLDLPLNLVVVP